MTYNMLTESVIDVGRFVLVMIFLFPVVIPVGIGRGICGRGMFGFVIGFILRREDLDGIWR